MPAPKDRTTKKRKVFVRTPGGETVLHRRRFNTSKPVCAECGVVLKGVARGNPADVTKLSKTQRRPERPYGGVLCSKCTRKKLIKEARK